MLGREFPDQAWIATLSHLRKRDINNLRLSSKQCRLSTYEFGRNCPNQKQLNTFIEKADSARYLIRCLYVPETFRMRLPNNKFIELSRPEYVQPSSWKISSMTMLSYLSTPVDSRSVFHCLDAVDFFDPSLEQIEQFNQGRRKTGCPELNPIWNQNADLIQVCIEKTCECLQVFFPGILDIHFYEFCRGNPSFAEVKAKKRGRPTLKTFSNQCTLRLCLSHAYDNYRRNGQQWNIVNLKMFQNGMIQMTGCKTIEQAEQAVQFLIDKLMDKAPTMRAKRDCMTQMRCLAIDGLRSIREASRVKPCDEKSSIMSLNQDCLKLVMLQVHNETLFACRKVCKRFQDMLESHSFWITKSCNELRCKIEYSESKNAWYLTEKFNGRFNRMEPVRKPELFSHPRLLYCRHRALRRHKPFIVVEKYEKLFVATSQIAMMNTDFKTNFDLNLKTLYKILRRDYKLQADYSPDGYVAINVKYVSPIIIQSPIPIDDPDEELSTNDETTISFFIFRTGSVIINSARSVEQQNEAYEFLNNIFKKHYDKIWIAPLGPSSDKI